MVLIPQLPGSVCVASGKGGVGKSCIALNLALALCREGVRALLLEIDGHRSGAAAMAGLHSDLCLADAFAGRCTPEQAVVAGPGGLDVMRCDGPFPTPAETETSPALESLRRFESTYDVIVVDSGFGMDEAALRAAAAADEILFVATPEMTALADTYVQLKLVLRRSREPRMGLVVNMAESAREAAEIQDGFARLAATFLEARIDNRGYIPLDRYARDAARHQTPLAVANPSTPAAEAISELATGVSARCLPETSKGQAYLDRAIAPEVRFERPLPQTASPID